MSDHDTEIIEQVIDLCLEAREKLGCQRSMRLRILLDILLLELGRELARLAEQEAGTGV